MIRRSLQILTLVTSVAVLGAPSARNRAFQWPDSSGYWRVLVNVNQYVATYIRIHPQYFSRDKLVTDLTIHDVRPRDQDRGMQEYRRVRKLLESKGMSVGTYVSGTTVKPASMQTRWPPETVSLEQMPASAHHRGSWPTEPDRKIMDVSDVETRHAFEAGITQLWQRFPAPVRFVDNMPPHPKMKGPPWKGSCQYMAELGQMGASVGSRVIFNIAMHLGEMSDEETQELIKAVGQNGISLEMPWSEAIRKNKDATKRAEKRYRQLLDAGMAIILIPVRTPEDELTNWVRGWRKPTDHIYMAIPFQTPPDMAILGPS